VYLKDHLVDHLEGPRKSMALLSHQLQQELEQDPFDADEFVERLAWRTTGGRSVESFDPMVLHQSFEQTIRDLKVLNEKMKRKSEKLEAQVTDEEKKFKNHVGELLRGNQQAFAQFQELDEKINYVATKVVHLGEQLEGVNMPRSRAVEAQQLIRYFAEFTSNDDSGPKSPIFVDPNQLQAAADIIQKLHMMAQELPTDPKFEVAKRRISEKYDAIERNLIEDFNAAHRREPPDKLRMKSCATSLSHFKGYNQCIDAFIERCQENTFFHEEIHPDIQQLCKKTEPLINEVFTNPEAVMAKLVLNIYNVVLKNEVDANLKEVKYTEAYLKNLHDWYMKTNQLSTELQRFNMGTDQTFLTKLTKHIFSRYLDQYKEIEITFLRNKCGMHLMRYYDSKGHVKRQVQPSTAVGTAIQDIQAKIQAKSLYPLHHQPQIESFGGETFLSQEVAINLLQEFKMAFKRCQTLASNSTQLPLNALLIFDVMTQFLCVEHIDYALELGSLTIPPFDSKVEPELTFFDVVGQANAIFHLLEKQFSDCVVPLVIGSPQHSEALQRKRRVMHEMESKLDNGLDRSLMAIVGWVKFILSSEQKKTDFKPESEGEGEFLLYSQACAKVCKFMKAQVERIRESLDGENVKAVLTELGTRFHRVIYEHLQQFQYNSTGGMLAICDVREYRECVKEFKSPLVLSLFDTLHALTNLLVVVPDNLKQVCHGEHLAGLERPILHSFVQLRADYRTSKLSLTFK